MVLSPNVYEPPIYVVMRAMGPAPYPMLKGDEQIFTGLFRNGNRPVSYSIGPATWKPISTIVDT